MSRREKGCQILSDLNSKRWLEKCRIRHINNVDLPPKLHIFLFLWRRVACCCELFFSDCVQLCLCFKLFLQKITSNENKGVLIMVVYLMKAVDSHWTHDVVATLN